MNFITAAATHNPKRASHPGHSITTIRMLDNGLSPMTELKIKAYLVKPSPIRGARRKRLIRLDEKSARETR